MLVNCAGTSITGKFEDIDTYRFEVSDPSLSLKPFSVALNWLFISCVKVKLLKIKTSQGAYRRLLMHLNI